MKTKIISRQVLDYAISIVVSSVPGIAETDAETRETYKNISRDLLSSRIKSTFMLFFKA